MTSRKYQGRHQAIRKALVATIEGRRCARCGGTLHRGDEVDLDHNDSGVGYRGLAHAECNRRAGRLRQAELARERRRRLTMPDRGVDITVGIEFDEDRDHVSIGAAWWDPDKVPHVALVGYLDAAELVDDALAKLKAEHRFTAVLVGDQAGNLVPHLGRLAPTVARASAADQADAFGELRDRTKARTVRVRSRPELRRAIRHGQARRVGLRGAWLGRDSEVDMAPAIAVSLALWALVQAPVWPTPEIF